MPWFRACLRMRLLRRTTRLVTVVRVAASAALVLSCAGEATEGVEVTRRGGVRTTALPASPFETERAWTLGAEPRVSIGVADGDPAHELDAVVAARRLPDGSIAVANSGSGEIRIFDGAGGFVRAVGRAGGGPGEFRALGWLQVLPPDTLVALDIEFRRLSAFTADGALQWDRGLEGWGYPLEGDPRLPDGSSVILWQTNDTWTRIREGDLGAGHVDRSTAILARNDAGGAVLDTLGVFDGIEQAVFTSDGRPASRYPPWGRMAVFATADSLVWVGTQDEASIEALDPAGNVRERIRWPADLTLGDAEVDAFAQVEIDFSNADASASQAIRARWAGVARPPSLPAYGRIVADAGGRIWVSERYVPLIEPRRWVVLEPGADVLGRIDVPDRFRIFEVGPDWVLGRSTDALGVERVLLYDLYRS